MVQNGIESKWPGLSLGPGLTQAQAEAIFAFGQEAVVMRKTSYNNRSDKGAVTQSVLMSVMATLKQRGLNPVETVKTALSHYIKTGKLPSLAELTTSAS